MTDQTGLVNDVVQAWRRWARQSSSRAAVCDLQAACQALAGTDALQLHAHIAEHLREHDHIRVAVTTWLTDHHTTAA
jgi:hypothetical protein